MVEYIRPGLLAYICKHLLKKTHRTNKPETVKALVVHRWIMKRHESALNTEDDEGVKVKAIKITLTGEAGVRSVQRAFILLDELRTKYRLRTEECEMIKWITYNIQPKSARETVQNYLKQSGKKARRACKKMESYHDLVMDMAQQFERSYELGMRPKKKSQNGNERNKGSDNTNSSDQPVRSTKPSVRTGELKKLSKPEWLKVKKSLDSWVKAGKCVYCGQQHKVTECPTIPNNMKDWSWTKIFRTRGHASKAQPSDNNYPGGDKDARSKKKVTSNPGVKVTLKPMVVTVTLRVLQRKLTRVTAGKIRANGADRVAVIDGVAGFYTCDGGCDQATIGVEYAKQLEKNRKEVFYYEEPKPAKLADGSVKNSIVGFCVLDVELITRAGNVVLPRTHIDVLEGPESTNLLYLGQVEERRLSLKTFAEQLEDMARRGSGTGAKRRILVPCLTEGGLKKSKEGSVVKADGAAPISRAKVDGADAKAVKSAKVPTKRLAEVWDEGSCFISPRGWSSLSYVPYVLEPLAEDCSVTTAALSGDEVPIQSNEPKGGVIIFGFGTFSGPSRYQWSQRS